MTTALQSQMAKSDPNPNIVDPGGCWSMILFWQSSLKLQGHNMNR